MRSSILMNSSAVIDRYGTFKGVQYSYDSHCRRSDKDPRIPSAVGRDEQSAVINPYVVRSYCTFRVIDGIVRYGQSGIVLVCTVRRH